MKALKFEQIETNQDERIQILRQGLQDSGAKQIPGLPDLTEDKTFGVFVSDDAKVVAGIYASGFWNALHVELLWVDEAYRGRGLAVDLLKRAELYALKQGFAMTYLDTVMAKGFYLKQGYTVFGELKDQPEGHSLYFMTKRLRD